MPRSAVLRRSHPCPSTTSTTLTHPAQPSVRVEESVKKRDVLYPFTSVI